MDPATIISLLINIGGPIAEKLITGDKAKKYLAIGLAAATGIPTAVAAVEALNERLKKGEPVTDDELDQHYTAAISAHEALQNS